MSFDGILLYLFSHFNSHSVLLKVRNILALIDLGFVEMVSDYFKGIFADTKLPQRKKDSQQEAQLRLKEGVGNEEKQDREQTKKKPVIPTIKVDASIQDVRVALIETVESPEPQALTLKVS